MGIISIIASLIVALWILSALCNIIVGICQIIWALLHIPACIFCYTAYFLGTAYNWCLACFSSRRSRRGRKR